MTGRSDFHQEQFLNVLSREDALARFEGAVFPREKQIVSCALLDALNLPLAYDVAAPVDTPPFDRSNVDGFAILAGDLSRAGPASPVILRLSNEIVHCGVAPQITLVAGSATPIATGAPLPRGADAVLMVEHTNPHGPNEIEVSRGAAPGQFVSFAGSDIARGESLLRAGCVLGSREIGMLAACGIGAVAVVRRPRVAVLSTGDELRIAGQALSPAAISHTEIPTRARPSGVPLTDNSPLSPWINMS